MRPRTTIAACLFAIACMTPASALAGSPRAVAVDPPGTTSTAAAPALPTAPVPAPNPPAAYADPLAALGAGSPACQSDLTAQARRNCRATGAVEDAYPLSSYGLDVQVDFSVTHLQDSFLGALQNIAALIWMALVYLVKGVMLLLEWGFSIDLLGSAMSDVRNTLNVMHQQVIGQPWFLAALSVTALWGMWHGLVQRRTTQTFGALAATVGLMLCALVVLARPDDTVGYASRLANQASVGILAATTGQDINHPGRALSGAMIGVFDSIVRDPWCALEFGSVDYCHKHAKGTTATTNADVWLAYPAGSGERRSLYKLLKGDKLDTNSGVLNTLTQPLTSAIGVGGGKDTSLPGDVKDRVAKEPARVQIQDAGGTVPRFALLALIAVGMTGAIALLAYLGVRLLLAAILALILLLLAPAMLLAPAFGASGRATFIAWGRRLFGALAAKLVYSLFLAVVLAAAATLRGIDIGWFGTWLLQITFWWGVLIKRQELIGFVSAGAPVSHGEHTAGSLLSKGYYATQLGRTAHRTLANAGRYPRAAASHVGQSMRERGTARQAATTQLAREQLDAGAATVIAARQEQAHVVVERRDSAQREVRALDRHLAGHDEARAAARAQGLPEPVANEQQAAMLTHRSELQTLLAAPESRAAQQVVQRAERTHAEHGTPVSPRDIEAYRRGRERDLRNGLPSHDPRHLEAAGVSPTELAAAAGPQRTVLLARIQEHVDTEQQLALAAEGRRAEVRLDPRALRTRSAEERDRIRRERRERRTRANVFRGN